MNEQEHIELETLCDAFLDEAISVEDRQRLETLLLDSEEARAVYVRRSALRSSLQYYAAEAQSSADAVDHEVQTEVGNTVSFYLLTTLKWAAALVAAFVLGALIWGGSSERAETAVASADVAESTYEGVAVLIQGHDVEWPAGGRVYQNGDSIPAGRFRLESGVVQLEFYSGATMVLEGSADLDILSEDKAFCHYGRATVSVSPHARGFTIDTPDVNFVDLGTEFGLSVTPGQPSELHVFSGEVEVYEKAAGSDEAPAHTLVTGDAAQFISADERTQIALNSESFWDVRKLVGQASQTASQRFQDWATMAGSIAQDADVIRFYSFTKTEQWVRQLEDMSQPDVLESRGAIVGAHWEQGRWGEKSALLFDHPSDRVRFDISGEYDSITFATWIKVQSLKNVFNGLFMTDGFNAGNPHWQMNNEGQLILGIKCARKGQQFSQYVSFSPPVITPERYGRWVHLASSFDTATSEIKHYLNGELIEASGLGEPANTKIRIGSGELGNWGLPKGGKAHLVRNFQGVMDEFVCFSRVLSSEEIAELYRVGTPYVQTAESRQLAQLGASQ